MSWSVVSESLQATLHGVQASLASIETVIETVSTTSAVLMPELGVLSQRTRTTTPIYP